MTTIYVARSKTLSDWGYDVGLSKHLYRVGLADDGTRKALAAEWAGVTDWVLVKKQDGVTGLNENEVVTRLAAKVKMIEPRLYPRIRDAIGLFKVVPAHVENHLIVGRAMAGEGEIRVGKIKPVDIAAYLIANAVP